ncbi:hypothetical protein ACGTN6_18940 [Halomonas sp. THAF12]|uniref:hypothetical protein n=1 Tax=Halomonas sp. B23F22_10 TaxID=3459515 RepID=UPI00373EF8AD
MKLTSLSDSELLDVVRPLAEHTEASWNDKDYQAFCRYLILDEGERVFPEAEFQRQIEESYDTYGVHRIGELVAIHRNPDNVIVIWKVEFEKREAPGLLMYGFEEHEGEVRIAGCSYHA